MARKRRPPLDPITNAINQFTDTLNNQFDVALHRLIDNLIAPPEMHLPHSHPNPHPNPRPTASPRAARQPHNITTFGLSLYDVLEVSPHASKETIDAAYKSLSKRFHPDNLKTGDAEHMRRINAAHMILGDDKKRKEYDRLTQIRSART